MLKFIVIVLVAAWLTLVLLSKLFGGWTHLLIVAAVIALVIDLRNRRA